MNAQLSDVCFCFLGQEVCCTTGMRSITLWSSWLINSSGEKHMHSSLPRVKPACICYSTNYQLLWGCFVTEVDTQLLDETLF